MSADISFTPSVSLGNIIATISIIAAFVAALRFIVKPFLNQKKEIAEIQRQLVIFQTSKKYWDMELEKKLIDVAHDFSTPEIDAYLDRWEGLSVLDMKLLIDLLIKQSTKEASRSDRRFCIDWLVLILQIKVTEYEQQIKNKL